MIRGSICLILLIICSVGSTTARTTKIYHDHLTSLHGDTIVRLTDADSTTLFKAIEVRASFPRKSPQSGNGSFGVIWGMTDRDNYSYATLSSKGNQSDDPFITPELTLGIGQTINGKRCPTNSIRLTKNMDTDGGENSLAVEITPTGLRLLAGHKSLREVYATPLPDPKDLNGALGLCLDGPVTPSMIVTEVLPDPKLNVMTGWDAQKINAYFSNGHREAPEGLWKYLDRNNDPAYTRPGGYYQLAIVRHPGSKDFDIIYISGAETASDSWTTGMLKGRLSPTTFSGHYDLQWFDSMMNLIDSECSATIESPAIIRFDFPLLKSSMRFSVLPQDK